MQPPDAARADSSDKDPYALSVMLGGPLYQFYRRAYLSGAGLELLRRRLVLIPLVAWLPLLVLTAIHGDAWSGVKVPFLLDVEMHARLLVALPLLIFAERMIHDRMPHVVRQFVDRQIVGDETRAAFGSAVASALRLRNSVAVEVLLLLFVYGVGVTLIWSRTIALPIDTWYRQSGGGTAHLTPAGWWYAIVSVPIFQFLLYRWYFRLIVWTRFLWQVSRLHLDLQVMHPDRNAGLGFLSELPRAFAPFVLAHGALLAGMIADGIFFTGMTLAAYKLEIAVLIALVIFFVVGPLLVFVPVLMRARRAGVLEYGLLAENYVRGFDRKWLRGDRPADEPLLGSADIQSLADLAGSFEIASGVQFVPVELRTLAFLAIVAALPIAPLLLTMISLDELLTRLAKMLL